MRPQTFCEAELQRVFPDDVDDASQTIAVLCTTPPSERFFAPGSRRSEEAAFANPRKVSWRLAIRCRPAPAKRR